MTTTNLEAIIRAAEKRNADTESAREALADEMRAKISQSREETARLAAVPDDLLARAEAGDPVDPNDLMRARTELEIAEKRLRGLEARTPRLGAQAATNLAGAEALRPVFEGLVNDVPVLVTNAPSSGWLASVADADAPAIVLAQVADTVNAADGLLTSGEIEATFIAPAWAGGITFLDLSQIEQRAREAGIGLDLMSYGDYRHDRIGIDLTSAFEPVPVVTRVDDTTAAHDFAARLLSGCNVENVAPANFPGVSGIAFRGLGPGQILRNGVYEPNVDGVIGNFTLRVERTSSVETVTGGERNVRVSVSFGVAFGGTATQVAQNKFIAHNAAKDAAAGLVGDPIQGLGRVTTATYEPVDGNDDLNGVIAIEYVSRIPGK